MSGVISSPPPASPHWCFVSHPKLVMRPHSLIRRAEQIAPEVHWKLSITG